MGIAKASNSEPLIRNEETMRYRPLGTTGLEISALSFGCMRLGEDQDLNTELISKAIDLGVNYFETTRGYCNGQCQQRTAPGLKGKTSGVIVSGKAALRPDTTEYTFRKEIELQLEILGLTHFKFFQVGWFRWPMLQHLLKRGGLLDALRRAQDEGLIQHVGFTGHDAPENFTRVIETGLFDTLTIPYSLINQSYEPTIARAGELGVGVVAMCPVAGGALAQESSALKEELGMDLPTTEMALRFVLSNPDISTACSGMNAMEHLEQNVKTVKAFDPSEEGIHERFCEGLERIRARLGDRVCTKCRYCMPCPEGINIPAYMDLYLFWKAFGLEDMVRKSVKNTPEARNMSRCTDCGACEEKCPNGIPVRETFKELATLL